MAACGVAVITETILYTFDSEINSNPQNQYSTKMNIKYKYINIMNFECRHIHYILEIMVYVLSYLGGRYPLEYVLKVLIAVTLNGLILKVVISHFQLMNLSGYLLSSLYLVLRNYLVAF